MTYKNYQISDKPVDYGFYEAYSLIDCDALMIHAKTIEQIKIEIDELHI